MTEDKVTAIRYRNWGCGSSNWRQGHGRGGVPGGCGRACRIGWVDIGTRKKVLLEFVTDLLKITRINEKSVLTQ
jgi:hypothetical protein